MSWIDIVLIFLVLGAVIAVFMRVSKSKIAQELKHIVCGLARVECRCPRLTPGVAAIMPAVAREPLLPLYCTRWKYHDGEHESPINHGPGREPGVERWFTS